MEKGKRRIVEVGIALLLIQLTVLLLAIGVCSGEKPTKPGVIKIGINGSFTGRGALYGTAIVNGGGIIVGQVNAEGGITVGGKKYLVELVPYDHAMDPANGLENTKRMVYTDKVQFAVMQNLTASLPGFPMLTENKIVSTDQCTGTKSLDPKFPYNFRTIPDPDGSLSAIFKYAAENKGAKTFVTINPDDEAGWSVLGAAQRSAERSGLKMLGGEFYSRGTSDFYPLLTKIIAKKPDLVDFGTSYPGDVAIMVKQIRELDYKGLLSAMWPFLTEESLKTVGKGAMEGMIALMGGNPPHLEPEYLTSEEQAFIQAGIKKHGLPFEVTNFAGATTIVVLLEGIKRANSLDPHKIKKVLETSELMVFGRKTKFGGTRLYGQPHQMLMNHPMYEVRDGKARFQRWVPPIFD